MTAAPEREINADLRDALHDSSGAYELVIGALAAAGFGYLIDRAFGVLPLFTIAFAVLGFAGATLSLFYRYRDRMSEAGAQRSQRRDRTSGGQTLGEATA